MKTTQKYATKTELIEAKAQAQHFSNLTSGGIYDYDLNRISDIQKERACAALKVTFVGSQYAKLMGLPESKNAWYIAGFGYATK